MTADLVRLWGIFDRRTRSRAVLLFSLNIVAGILEGMGIGMIFPLLKIAGDPESILTIDFIAWIFTIAGEPQPQMFIAAICAAIFALFLVKNALLALISWIQFDFVWTRRAEVASRLFAHYLRAEYAFHLQRNTATLLRNVTVAVQEIFAGLLLPAVLLLTELVVAGAILALLIAVEPKTTLVVAGLLGGLLVLYYRFVRTRLKAWGEETQNTNQSTIHWVNQAMGGIKEIKVLGREDYFERAFENAMLSNSASRRRYGFVSQLPRFALETIAIGLLLGAVVVILFQAGPPRDLFPLLGLFAVAAVRLMPSINRIAGYINNLRFGGPALDVVYNDLRLQQDAQASAEDGGSIAPVTLSRGIVLEGVSYRYPAGEAPAIADVSMTIPRGQSIALVGTSGAGKTTLVDVILGLLKPQVGRILVDEQDINAALPGWQQLIGYVPQDVFLTDDTVRRNVALGVPDNEISDVRVHRALGRAQLAELVAGLSEGLDTQLGERGARLSGGERQRIGIARALYRDAELLVLDEATSSLDSSTETEIARAIDALRGEKTLIIIAHRLSTVRKCDQLYFISGGRIVDSGTFEQLAHRSDAFRTMIREMDVNTPDPVPAERTA